jgi:hypothetical protein
MRGLIALTDKSQGLCNRLKLIVSCQRIATTYNIPLSVYWESKGSACAAEFHELFETPSVPIIVKQSVPKYDRLFRYDVSEKQHNLMALTKALAEQNSNTFAATDWRLWVRPEDFDNQFAENQNSIEFLYDQIPKNLIEIYSKLFKQFKLIPRLHEKSLEYLSALGQNYIGVHVRRGDFLKHEPQYLKASVADYFKAVDFELDKAETIKKIWLSSDCEMTVNSFKKRYGTILLSQSSKNYSRNSSEGIKDAVLDLKLLSQCNVLFVTPRSTFSEVAWWLGHQPKTILVRASTLSLRHMPNMARFAYQFARIFYRKMKNNRNTAAK